MEKNQLPKKNWLARQSLHFIEYLTQAEQEGCNAVEGSFDILKKYSNHITIKPSNTANTKM